MAHGNCVVSLGVSVLWCDVGWGSLAVATVGACEAYLHPDRSFQINKRPRDLGGILKCLEASGHVIEGPGVGSLG